MVELALRACSGTRNTLSSFEAANKPTLAANSVHCISSRSQTRVDIDVLSACEVPIDLIQDVF